jgi:hypothetical protein
MNWTWLEVKQPAEIQDYTVTVDAKGGTIGSVGLVSSDAALVVSGDSISGQSITFRLTGGLDGQIYTVDLTLTLSDGRSLIHRVVVPVGGVYRTPATLDFLQACYRLRRFMRDLAARNTLLLNELEYTWDEMEMAIEDALSLWNGTPPLSSNVLSNINPKAHRVLYQDAGAYLLKMGSHQQSRNEIRYDDQGLSIQESDKTQAYMQLSQTLSQQADLDRRRIKTAMNMEATWGGTHHDTYDDPFGYQNGVYPSPGEQ